MQGNAPVRPWLGSLLAIALLFSLGCAARKVTYPTPPVASAQAYPPAPQAPPYSPAAQGSLPPGLPAAPPAPPLQPGYPRAQASGAVPPGWNSQPPAPPTPALPPPLGGPRQPSPGQLRPAQYAPSPSNPHGRSVKKTESTLVPVTDLEDFTLKTERMTFNNIALTSVPSASGTAGEVAVNVQACYRNRASKPTFFTLVLVGVDKNEDILWACQVSGRAEAKTIGCLPGSQVLLLPTPVKHLSGIRIRAHVAEDTRNQSVVPACYPTNTPPAVPVLAN